MEVKEELWKVRADEVLAELKRGVLPVLEAEERKLFSQRVILGLREQRGVSGERTFAYPPRRTGEEALIQARSEVLGDDYGALNGKRETVYKRLQRMNSELCRFERGLDVGREGFAMSEAQKRHQRIEQLHAKTSSQLSTIYITIQQYGERAREPNTARLIENRVADILSMDQFIDKQRKSIEERYRNTSEALSRGKELTGRLQALGTTEIAVARSPEFHSERQFFATPNGSDFSEWSRAVEQVRGPAKVYQFGRGV